MQRNYLKDAKRVYDVLKKGGIAIVYMRNAYAIMSGTDNALEKVNSLSFVYEEKMDIKLPVKAERIS